MAGAYLDPTGLYKIGQRYYHPDWGRWTQPDPIHAPLDPVNWNRYAYAGNNPTNYTDPTGLFSFGCFFNEFFGIGWQHTPESEGTGGGSSGPSIRPTFNGTAAVQFAAGNLWSFTAKRVAAELRKRWLSRLVPYVGWGFTAFSGLQVLPEVQVMSPREHSSPGGRTQPPLWAYGYFILQISSLAAAVVLADRALSDSLDHLTAQEWSVHMGLPALISMGLGWFNPIWWYESDDAEPPPRVRGWVVGLHAVWISLFPPAMLLLGLLIDRGTIERPDSYRFFVACCVLTLMVTAVLRMIVRTRPIVKIPRWLPCPYCGRRWSTRDRRCGWCSRERPSNWFLTRPATDHRARDGD